MFKNAKRTILLLNLLPCFLMPEMALSEGSHEHDHHHEKKRQHAAHEHGTATLNLVFDEAAMQIELLIPAVDVTGFGRKPQTPEEKQSVEKALELLKDTNKVLRFTEAAQCSTQDNVVEHTADQENSHSEFRARYHISCEQPASLESIALTLFNHFPSIEKIRGSAVIAGKQEKLALSKTKQTITIAKNR